MTPTSTRSGCGASAAAGGSIEACPVAMAAPPERDASTCKSGCGLRWRYRGGRLLLDQTLDRRRQLRTDALPVRQAIHRNAQAFAFAGDRIVETDAFDEI